MMYSFSPFRTKSLQIARPSLVRTVYLLLLAQAPSKLCVLEGVKSYAKESTKF